ncbi:hypothetical protein D3C85_1001660 [compost metagenome]
MHIANRAIHNQLTNLCVVRRITVVERHAKLFTCPFDCIENFLTFLFINCHRLFGNNVTTKLHRFDNVRMMRAVYRCYDDRIRLFNTNHLFELIRFIRRNSMIFIFCSQQVIRIVHAGLIDITNSNKLRCI